LPGSLRRANRSECALAVATAAHALMTINLPA
jgi:hypothetical protein